MTKVRYDELTWPQMREAIAHGPVVLLPFGTIEDHGPHLPLNTDNVIVEAICLEAARRAPGEMLVMPLAAYGLDEHHVDFPGTVSVDMQTLLAHLSDVAISAARHGFTHVLIVNGHGSNYTTHDLATAGYFTDRMAVMYLGRVVELGPTREVLSQPRHPYTHALLSVVPVPNPRRRHKRTILQGEIPNPIDVPPGCRFHPRCPDAIPGCQETDPQLHPVNPGHEVACIRA